MPLRCWPLPPSPHFVLCLAGCGDNSRRAPQSLSPTAGCRNFRSPRNAARSRCRRTATSPAAARSPFRSPSCRPIRCNPRPDPLFILAGGPGQAASFLGPFAAALTGVRKDRDIVLVDQRGTGRSSPLECAAFKPDHSLEAAIEFDPVPKAQACARELAAQGVDAAQYTTAAWVADLDAVRAALGYDKINLWGGSYGTRAALEYLRRHADHVRSVVLDGVAHAVDEIHARCLADARSRARRGVRSVRALAGLRGAPSRSFARRSTRFATSWGREGAMSR